MITGLDYKRLGGLASGCVLAGLSIGVYAARILARAEYRDRAQLLGAVVHSDSRTADLVVQAMKRADAGDFLAGETLLKNYGYSPNTFFHHHLPTVLLYVLPILLALGLLLGGLEIWSVHRRNKRISGLTSYLHRINQGYDAPLIRQEDVFSQLEDELFKTITELRETREKALRERHALADNLADISHQLKTPLTSMSLMTQLLTGQGGDEDHIYIEKLSKQISRLETLVTSLLTLSRLDAGSLVFQRETVRVYDVLLRASELVDEAVSQKNQQLLLPPESASSFTGDARWTAEAVLNLLKNCSDYSPEGGMITVHESQNPLYTEMMIEDNGKGFYKEDIPRLFQRFYKGRNASADSIGIGLALSKSIIAMQNGIIRAENAPNGGARFIIRFYT